MSIFGDETIPVGESPDTGHEETTAVETEGQEVEQEEQQEQTEQEVQEESDPDAGNSEQLLAGKYKTTDDLVKAYKNAQRKISELSQQAKQQPAQQQRPQHPSVDPMESFWEDFNQNPLRAVQTLVQAANAPYEQQREMDSLSKNFDGIAKEYGAHLGDEGAVDQLFGKIAEIAEEMGNPKLMRNPSPRILRMAANELWGNESKAKIYQSAMEQGRKEAEDNRRAKQGIAVNVSKKPQETPKTEADLIRESILAASKGSSLFG